MKPKFRKIRLYPTSFYLYVFMGYQSKEDLMDKFKVIFPKNNWDGYFEELCDTCINYVESMTTVKEGKVIVLVSKDPTVEVLVHEIVHVLNHLSGYTNVEIGINAQEWNAYFQEYVFEELNKMIK